MRRVSSCTCINQVAFDHMRIIFDRFLNSLPPEKKSDKIRNQLNVLVRDSRAEHFVLPTERKKALCKLMVFPRLPYQVQTADMFPPTNNKKASLCPNLKPQTHKHHTDRHCCAISPNISPGTRCCRCNFHTKTSLFLFLDKFVTPHFYRLVFGGRACYYPPLLLFHPLHLVE